MAGSKQSPHPIMAGSKSPTRHSAFATARRARTRADFSSLLRTESAEVYT